MIDRQVDAGQVLRAMALGAALLFATGAFASSKPDDAGACDRELIRVAVVDDEPGILPSLAEQYRALKLPSLAILARRVVETQACLHLWDAAEPGGPAGPPGAILKVRPTRIALRETSIAAKAETAVTRYIGSYLGTNSEELPVVDRAEVMISVHCPGRKGARVEVSGVEEGGLDGDPVLRGTIEHPIDRNAERFARALRNAAEDAVAEIRKAPALCEGGR